MLAYRAAHANQFYGCFSHEICGSEACSKIAKFCVETTSRGHRSGDVDNCNDDPDLLKKIVTGDESWIYGHDIKTKVQSHSWKRPEEPRPKKARQVLSNVKVLLTVFFDCNGVVHHKFLPQGRTVDKEYRLEVMRQKRTELWKNQSWIFHHNKAPAHTCLNFWLKTTTVFTGLGPRWLLPLSKTENTDERKAFCFV